MWQDQRLLTAIAALPAEAFLEVAPDGDRLVGRFTARLPRRESGADTESGRTPDTIDTDPRPPTD